jgi:steroid delta-isomerase-like uncharacterized protein
MSNQDNKALVRRFLGSVIGAHDPAAAAGVLTSDYTVHMPGLPGPVRGLDQWTGLIGSYFAAFPDLEIGLEDEIAEGDRVAIRYVWTGTHRADFMGIPATGRAVRVPGTVVFRIADARVAEEWHFDDVLGLMQQLEVGSPQSSPAAAS